MACPRNRHDHAQRRGAAPQRFERGRLACSIRSSGRSLASPSVATTINRPTGRLAFPWMALGRGLISAQPQPYGRELDECEVVGRQLVVAGCHAPGLNRSSEVHRMSLSGGEVDVSLSYRRFPLMTDAVEKMRFGWRSAFSNPSVGEW
jgi:hypothetical protein